MSRRTRIPLILLGLASFFVSQGLPSVPIVPESETPALEIRPARATPPHRDPSLIEHRSPEQQTEFTGPQTPYDTRGSHREARAQQNLDLASAREIRETLRQAIENEQQNRSLFVSPGIIDAVARQQRVRVIFEIEARSIEEAAIALLAGSSGRAEFDSLRIFPLLDRGAAAVGPQALLHLIENAATAHIELDAVHRPSLAETIPIIRADLAHQRGHDGDGFAVAILDTGVDPTHPMYAGRIIEEACFSLQNDCPNGQSEMFGPGASVPCAISSCGHGTRIAGIMLGDDPAGRLIGAAPHAALITIQIFSIVDGELGAFSSDILAGLQHVLGLTTFHQIASINLSLGGALFTSEADCDQAVASQFSAVALLRSAGISTVAASGNESLTNAITTPACLSNVIGVGSTSDIDDVSSFSNSASFMRLLAPGESVESSSVGGGTALASGTSMASAHVAGAIATIREAVPNATADEIENALALSGVAVFDSRSGFTTPRIQLAEAITLLETTMGSPAEPNGSAANGSDWESSPAAATTSSSGGGGCGLVGIECFLVLGLARLAKRWRFARRQHT